MIGGVPAGLWSGRRFTAADDAPGAAMPQAGRGHGVFAVMAARFQRQPLFEIAELDAVAPVGKTARP